MKNKRVVFILFSFVLASIFALTPVLSNVHNVFADSNDEENSEDGDFFSESDKQKPNDVREDRREGRFEKIDDRIEKREKIGALGIPELQSGVSETPDQRVRLSDKDRVRNFNRDKTIGWSDLRIIFTNWGNCRSLTTPIASSANNLATDAVTASRHCSGDINQDGTVDILDLEKVVDSWTDGNDEDKEAAKKVIEACRSVIGTEAQRACFLKTLQNREVDIKTRRATISWQPKTDTDRGDRREENIEKRVSNYLKYMGNMITRMYAAVERLETLSQRISSRIEKLEEDGKDMNTPKELLSDAQNKIDNVRGEIKDLAGSYESLIEVTNPKESFEEIKLQVRRIRDLLKDVHQSLVEVITNIKAGLDESIDDQDTIVTESATTN